MVDPHDYFITRKGFRRGKRHFSVEATSIPSNSQPQRAAPRAAPPGAGNGSRWTALEAKRKRRRERLAGNELYTCENITLMFVANHALLRGKVKLHDVDHGFKHWVGY